MARKKVFKIYHESKGYVVVVVLVLHLLRPVEEDVVPLIICFKINCWLQLNSVLLFKCET